MDLKGKDQKIKVHPNEDAKMTGAEKLGRRDITAQLSNSLRRGGQK